MNLFNNKLRPEERESLKQLSKIIADLKQVPGWGNYKKAAESLIETMTPKVSEIQNETMQVSVASRMCYIQGIKDCLGIVEDQEKLYKELKGN